MRGLSQRKVAELAGMSSAQVGTIELGLVHCNVSSLCRLAQALEVSPGYLLALPDEDDDLVSTVALIYLLPDEEVAKLRKELEARLAPRKPRKPRGG
jgi:transcriptional regulator with XRE-family HTH domain